MDIDIDEAVARAAADPAAGDRLIEQLLAIRTGGTWRGSPVATQAAARACEARQAGKAACVAAAVQATGQQLGRLHSPLLEGGGSEVAWAILLAAGAGAGHARAVDAAVAHLVYSDRRLATPAAKLARGAERWACSPQTAAAIERGLGFIPGDISSGRRWRSVRRTLVSCLRRLSTAEVRWWEQSGPPLPRGHLRRIADPAADAACDSLTWLLYCDDDLEVDEAAQVAGRMTAASAGQPRPVHLLPALEAVYRYRPGFTAELFAANADTWVFYERGTALPSPTPQPQAWDAPMLLAARHPDTALRLWLGTGTAPTPEAVRVGAGGLDPATAAVAAALASLLHPDRCDDRLAALIGADTDAVTRAGLLGLIGEAYRRGRQTVDQPTVAYLAAAAPGTADDWLLGHVPGCAAPRPGTAAATLVQAGRRVFVVTALEAFREGIVDAGEVRVITDPEKLDEFAERYGDHPAVFPQQLHTAWAERP